LLAHSLEVLTYGQKAAERGLLVGPAAAKMDGAKERQSKTTSLTYVGEARRAAHPARPEQDERLRE